MKNNLVDGKQPGTKELLNVHLLTGKSVESRRPERAREVGGESLCRASSLAWKTQHLVL